MASNKYLISDRSVLLKKKLENLSTKLQGALRSGEFETQEEYILEAVKIVGSFYKSMLEPQLTVGSVRSDDLPDPELYNLLWQQLISDLTVIFLELENIEDMTLANFNFMITESNRLTARLKAVFSKLGDYILYSANPLKDAIYFKDSFNDLSKIEVNSPLLNASECEMDQTQGIVTLPVDKESDSIVQVTGGIIINPNSNGSIGNNQQIGANYNGDTATLLDNNGDTWFEYERVVTVISDDKKALILDMTINLGEETIINHIRLNPNNFGTKTIIQIDEIETSIDGQVYTSIKDDIPIAGFTTEDEENIFTLAPSTSKYAGQGLYTFTPRKAKYIHLVMKQTEAYVIDTPAGQRLRYAIGLRDIDIRAFKYENKGELVSTAFNSLDEIRRIILQTNQNPSSESELASIQYFISPDSGSTWKEIQPKGFTGFSGIVSIPEILEFNGSSTNTIKTAVPVNSLRLKCVLSRNDDNFIEGASSFYKTQLTKSEMHTVPNNSPYNITMEESPVDGTVQVIDPMFGSRGDPRSPYIIGHMQNHIDQQKYLLPFKVFPRPTEKIETTISGINNYYLAPQAASSFMHVKVGGEEWSHATSPISGFNANWETGDVEYIYMFNVNTGELQFGNNINTAAPPVDAPITMYFEPERIYPSSTEDSHIAKLDFFTSTDKTDMIIKRYDKIISTSEVLPRKATVLRLKNQFITDITNIESKLGAGNKKEFINGKDELLSTNDWSIDTEKGVIYKLTPTASNSDLTVSYKYQPIYTLTESDWDWATSNILRDSIAIKESAWKTISIAAEEIYVPPAAKVLDFPHLSIVKASIKFTLEGTDADDSSYNPFLKEVPFIDGRSEFTGDTIKTTELLGAITGGVVNQFYFGENISTSTDLEVLFSNTTIFASEADPPATDGQYQVDRTNGWFKVFSDDDIAEPGTVSYFYPNPNNIDNGLYSIDYSMGTIYTQRPMSPTVPDWTLSVDYEYTDFRAQYRIARVLDPKTYKVDITNGTITFKDSEILKHTLIPREVANGRDPQYLVNYEYVSETREDIEGLKNFFSPIIKDYAIKVLTKGRII